MSSINSITYQSKNHGEFISFLKASKLFVLIQKSKFFVFSCSSKTTKELENIIRSEILTNTVGRKTLKQLMTDLPITVVESPECKYAFSVRDRKILANVHVIPYYMAEDEEGSFFCARLNS